MPTNRSIREIAYEVIKEAKQPLHYKDITERVSRVYNFQGKSPHLTVRSELGRDQREKRVEEGVYALSEWEEYPEVRFAKDIGYEILRLENNPIHINTLGDLIFEERIFKSPPRSVVMGFVGTDDRFIYNPKTELVIYRNGRNFLKNTKPSPVRISLNLWTTIFAN